MKSQEDVVLPKSSTVQQGRQPSRDTSTTPDGLGCDDANETKNYRPNLGIDIREFCCGWGAASINVVITFPLNKLMFRQQLYGITTSEALKQLSKEGMIRLYRGMLPPLIQKTACLSVMFGMYDGYQRILINQFPHAPLLANKATAAVLAGCTEAILAPLERVQTLLQDKYYHKHFRNTVHALKELHKFGLVEYYRGLTPILMRNGPSNAMFFLLRGEIKKMFPEADTSSGEMFQNFISGGILGASISTLFFPVNVVKAHMQARLGTEFINFRTAFWIIYDERGGDLRQMFRGVHINFTRSMISWGVINALYELLKDWFYSFNQ